MDEFSIIFARSARKELEALEVLADTPRKTEWVPHLKTARIVRETSPTDRVEYQRTRAPWPVKDRDFVFHALVEPDAAKKRLSIWMASIEGEAPREGAVRGTISGKMIIEAEAPDMTRVTFEINNIAFDLSLVF